MVHQSMRATRVKHPTSDVLPPIRATVVASDNNVCIRISDQGIYVSLSAVQSALTNAYLQEEGSSRRKSSHPLTYFPSPTYGTLRDWQTLG